MSEKKIANTDANKISDKTAKCWARSSTNCVGKDDTIYHPFRPSGIKYKKRVPPSNGALIKAVLPFETVCRNLANSLLPGKVLSNWLKIFLNPTLRGDSTKFPLRSIIKEEPLSPIADRVSNGWYRSGNCNAKSVPKGRPSL